MITYTAATSYCTTKIFISVLLVLCLASAIGMREAQAEGYYKFVDPVTGEVTFSATKRPLVGSNGPTGGLARMHTGSSAGIASPWTFNSTEHESFEGRRLEGKINGDRSLRWGVKGK